MSKKAQKEADKLIAELEQDINALLPEGSRCMKLLYQEVDEATVQLKGKFLGYREGKPGVYQFVLDYVEGTITVGEEVQETA